MKVLVQLNRDGTVGKVLSDTTVTQVLILASDVEDLAPDEIFKVDGRKFSTAAVKSGLVQHDAEAVASSFATVISQLRRASTSSAHSTADALASGLLLDYCATGSGECSCAKFGDDPTCCERGIENAILCNQATLPQYSFNERGIGTALASVKPTAENFIARPASMSNMEWTTFAGQLCALLNKNSDGAI